MNTQLPRHPALAAAIGMAVLLTLAPVPLAGAADGQAGDLRIESLTVDLRPEYDTRGEMLAIYQATYVNTGATPVEAAVALWVPAGTRLGETCELTAEDEHLCQLPQVSPAQGAGLGNDGSESQGLWVRWSMGRALAPGERYRAYMEFYVPVDIATPERTVTFRYPGTPRVGRVQVHFMRPLGAAGFVSDPEPTSRSSSDTAPVFYYELAPEPGAPIVLTARYTRTASEPFAEMAVSGERASGGKGPEAGVPGSMLLSQVGSWGLGVIVLAVLTYFLVRETTGRSRRHAPAQAAARVGGSGSRASNGKPRRHSERPQEERPGGHRLKPGEERRLARQALLEGRISETTYRELLSELEEKGR